MNKIGIHYGYWIHAWDVDDIHPYMDKAARLGFDILEISPGVLAPLSSMQRKEIKARAQDSNLALTCCYSLSPRYDLASPDRQIRADGIAHLRQLVQAVADAGGNILGGILYGAWQTTMPEGESDKWPYVERSIACMKEVAKFAEDQRVILCMEAVNRFEQFILNTCSEAIAYVDAVGSPNVKIMLDTFHMNIEENFLGDAILRAGSSLGHFHVGENNRMPPGYGHIPWTEVGSALRKIEYQGSIVMEPFLMPGGQVGREIKVFRDLSQGLDLDAEARKALLFTRGLLK
ncbi:MAG: sugar phosphate isomerase/epimerase family protein [Omnitrophica WOR_2 bacterium]